MRKIDFGARTSSAKQTMSTNVKSVAMEKKKSVKEEERDATADKTRSKQQQLPITTNKEH